MDKLYGKRKERRDRNVREFAFEHPHLGQKSIADAFGLTQGTVSKILKRGQVSKLLNKIKNKLEPSEQVIYYQKKEAE